MTATQEARWLKQKYKRDYKNLMKETWTRKPKHVKLQKYMDNEHIDVE